MEITQNPLGQIESLTIKDPENLTIKYIPIQNDCNETPIEAKLIRTEKRTELIEREIIFDAPNKDVVLKVINVLEDIEIKDAKVTCGTILVTGYLNSCIMYTTTKRPEASNNNQEKNNQTSNGYVTMNNNKSNENNKTKNKEKEKPKPSCDIVDNSIALDGVLRHTTVRIPFKALLTAQECKEEDICIVTSTNILKDLGPKAITPIYEKENEEDQVATNARVVPEPKFLRGIINKTLIELTVDIKRYHKE